jgi:hypothetical protein
MDLVADLWAKNFIKNCVNKSYTLLEQKTVMKFYNPIV